MPSLSFKAITPTHIPSTKQYLDAIRKGAEKTTKLTERDLESTVRTWTPQNKPHFEITVSESGGDYSITAGTDSLLYLWTDQGTRPHIIRPRKSPYLHFAFGGRPKTRPGIIGSQKGAAGTEWRRAMFVLHPGTTARKFTQKIKARRQKTLEQETSQNIAKVARTQQ